ncbi:hypothetical protein OE88DRAFT_1646799 [Heliocybe sulcata]|uniref:Tc1-like transposase DDE domain-containing protein n=1 Tax=Heliocybe sulcata TaxID=5364 RepID=A0A5C3MV31_9AGAM|nr:hypothetical protein OE88DRAFT_1646799 [Heliocybe sulcata]
MPPSCQSLPLYIKDGIRPQLALLASLRVQYVERILRKWQRKEIKVLNTGEVKILLSNLSEEGSLNKAAHGKTSEKQRSKGIDEDATGSSFSAGDYGKKTRGWSKCAEQLDRREVEDLIQSALQIASGPWRRMIQMRMRGPFLRFAARSSLMSLNLTSTLLLIMKVIYPAAGIVRWCLPLTVSWDSTAHGRTCIYEAAQQRILSNANFLLFVRSLSWYQLAGGLQGFLIVLCSALAIREGINKSAKIAVMLPNLQPDFQAQTSLIQEAIDAAGHLCIILPKFHCELNFIEFFWGAVKKYLQENCDYTFDMLKANLPKALASVQLQTIHK